MLRAKVDEAIQGWKCAVNTYPIILPHGFQSRQSAELLSIFPCLLKGRNHEKRQTFFLIALIERKTNIVRVANKKEGSISILVDPV